MSYKVFVYSHALKHGLTESEIRSAWNNAIEVAQRERDDGEFDWVAIGAGCNGRLIEMVTVHGEAGFLIFHANTPPTPRALQELGLTRRKR